MKIIKDITTVVVFFAVYGFIILVVIGLVLIVVFPFIL